MIAIKYLVSVRHLYLSHRQWFVTYGSNIAEKHHQLRIAAENNLGVALSSFTERQREAIARFEADRPRPDPELERTIARLKGGAAVRVRQGLEFRVSCAPRARPLLCPAPAIAPAPFPGTYDVPRARRALSLSLRTKRWS